MHDERRLVRMGLVILLVLVVAVVGVVVVTNRRRRERELELKRAELEPVKQLAFEDVTALGVALQDFDTELAGRLLGYPRVGLATLVEELTGRRLRKEHSAVDWSRRPLPTPWLEYAALDVEVTGADGSALATIPVTARIDTPTEAAYYRHGGILPYVLRQHLASVAGG